MRWQTQEAPLMADSNLTALRVAKEPSFGVAPSNPVFKEIRRTSDAIAFTPTNEVSNEIDSTRQVNDLINTGRDAGGDMATELSIENMDSFLEGLFCNSWLRTPEVANGARWEYGASATRITATSATTITLAATSVLSGSAINSTGAAFVVGMLIRQSGMAAGNGIYRVAGSTATTITIAGGGVDAAPGANARVKVIGFEGASGDIAAVVSGGSALTSTTLNFTTLGLMVGQWVKISNEGGAYSFATAANNGFARISAIASNRLSFDITQGIFAADTGTGKTIRVYFGDTIRNGTTQFTYRLEKQYLLNNVANYSYASGQQPASLALSAETRGVVTATVSWMGSDLTAPTTTRDSGATTEGISTNSVLDGSNSVPMIIEAGAVLGSPNYVSGFAFTLDNGLRAQNAIGSAGAIGIGMGRISVTGTLTTYFGDVTRLNKLRNVTASGATIAFRDAANNCAEIWDIPRLKYTSGFPEVPGIDTDLMTPLGFQALRDIANGRDYTLLLSRFDYLA
jgi:hypothetical protein